jgi:hypothetical protein
VDIASAAEWFDTKMARTSAERAAQIILEGVAKNKARVLVGTQGVTIEDLGSASGIVVNGKRIRLTPKKIVTGPSNVFQAEVLLKSVLRAGTADNDINPVKSMGLLTDGQANLSRITSNTAFWVETDAPEGLKLAMRRGLEKSMEGDFETDSMRYKATERYAFGWTDPRGVFGTPGI